MSRTDVHTPHWVKQRQKEWRSYFWELHYHVGSGECDLDVFLSSKKWTRTNCYLVASSCGRNIHCGCPLCTGRNGRKQQRRIERGKWRAQRQRILAFLDKEDVDIFIPKSQDLW